MAGARVTHGATVTGTVAVPLSGSWAFLKIVNWGTVSIMVVAQVTGMAAPTLTWKGDDIDVIPVGASVLVAVLGARYDQGSIPGPANPGVTAYVLAQTAGSDFTVTGAGN